MRVEELMIGDKVFSPDSIGIVQQIYISKDGEYRVVLLDYEDSYRMDVTPEELSPILLTKEILLMNGWEHEKAWDRYVGRNRPMIYASYDPMKPIFWLNYPSALDVKYIHELQRILRADGHFEEATNLKIK